MGVDCDACWFAGGGGVGTDAEGAGDGRFVCSRPSRSVVEVEGPAAACCCCCCCCCLWSFNFRFFVCRG